MTNFFLAFELDLTVVPVLNKVDLAHADVESVTDELESMFDINPDSVIPISAKSGLNIQRVLDAVVRYALALKNCRKLRSLAKLKKNHPRDIPPPVSQQFPGFWCFDAAEGSHGSRIHFVKNFGNSILQPGDRLKTSDSSDPIVVREVGRCLPDKGQF